MDQGSNPDGGEFPHLSRLALDLPSFLYNGYNDSFSWVKRLRHGIDRPTQSSAEVKD